MKNGPFHALKRGHDPLFQHGSHLSATEITSSLKTAIFGGTHTCTLSDYHEISRKAVFQPSGQTSMYCRQVDLKGMAPSCLDLGWGGRKHQIRGL